MRSEPERDVGVGPARHGEGVSLGEGPRVTVGRAIVAGQLGALLIGQPANSVSRVAVRRW